MSLTHTAAAYADLIRLAQPSATVVVLIATEDGEDAVVGYAWRGTALRTVGLIGLAGGMVKDAIATGAPAPVEEAPV